MLTISLLPNAEEGLFTLNVAKAVDITLAGGDVETMRGTQMSMDSQLSYPDLSQHDSRIAVCFFSLFFAFLFFFLFCFFNAYLLISLFLPR
jgi:hypothetical protein